MCRARRSSQNHPHKAPNRELPFRGPAPNHLRDKAPPQEPISSPEFHNPNIRPPMQNPVIKMNERLRVPTLRKTPSSVMPHQSN